MNDADFNLILGTCAFLIGLIAFSKEIAEIKINRKQYFKFFNNAYIKISCFIVASFFAVLSTIKKEDFDSKEKSKQQRESAEKTIKIMKIQN